MRQPDPALVAVPLRALYPDGRSAPAHVALVNDFG